MNGDPVDQPVSTAGEGSEGDRLSHDAEAHRFEFVRDGVALAHLEYVPRDAGDGSRAWAFTHTWTEPAARGKGLAAKVTVGALETARRDGVSVIAVCPYVVDFLASHPEYADLRPGGRTA